MKPLEFNKIYVIESLREKDIKTGQSLFNDTIKRRLEQKELFDNCELLMPTSKVSFFECLEHIRNETILRLVNPIIHFELHGSKEGIQVNNNDIITWDELQFKLTEINFISGCNLFITMATCYGGYIYSVIKPNLRSSFWGFVGAFDIVYGDEILENYSSFYDEFIQTLNINKAVKALNNSNSSGKSRFKFQNTEFSFNLAYNNYEKKYLTEEIVEKRLNAGLTQARKFNELVNWTDEAIKESLKFLMVDSKDLLKENMMTHFFMWDIFPENKPKK
jgi:hypothetical protein